MKEIELNSFYSWDYDEALAWLEEKQKAVLSGAAMQFAVGSHARAVVTLGRHTPDHQFIDRKKLLEENILIRRINRGGGMTAHEPGQIILYPVVSLSEIAHSVGSFTELLEKSVIKFLAMFNIVGSRDNSLGPGVYVQNKKIASIGFHVHKGVITHGVSINLKNNLKTFEHIAVCGHTDLVMTSVEKELRSLDGGSVKKLDLEKLGGELAHTCLDLL